MEDDRNRNENPETTLNGYQSRAMTTAAYPGRGEDQIIYPVIAMCEEAGELAEMVLKLLEEQQPKVDAVCDFAIAEAALTLATTCGAVMGIVKKAFRNDPQGQLTPERRDGLRKALVLTNMAVMRMSTVIMANDSVKLPSLPVTASAREGMIKEAGDLAWYLACLCTEAHVSLGHVGDANYAKLADRAKRNVIRSTGDDR